VQPHSPTANATGPRRVPSGSVRSSSRAIHASNSIASGASRPDVAYSTQARDASRIANTAATAAAWRAVRASTAAAPPNRATDRYSVVKEGSPGSQRGGGRQPNPEGGGEGCDGPL